MVRSSSHNLSVYWVSTPSSPQKSYFVPISTTDYFKKFNPDIFRTSFPQLVMGNKRVMTTSVWPLALVKLLGLQWRKIFFLRKRKMKELGGDKGEEEEDKKERL